MNRLLFVGIVLLIGCQPDDNRAKREGPEPLSEHFFELLRAKGHSEAFDYLFSTNKWISDSSKATVKSQFDVIAPQAGPISEVELLTKKGLGKDLILYSYLVKYERQPVRINLTYYFTNAKWQLLYFDSAFDLQDELIESAAAYRLEKNILSDHEEE